MLCQKMRNKDVKVFLKAEPLILEMRKNWGSF